jgi:FeS assembly SUF system protein
VGIFSFLSGKKDEADAPAESPKSTSTATATATATADEGWGAGSTGFASAPESGSSFTPPEAWNTEALTAPRPEAAVTDAPALGPVDADQTAALQPKIVDVIKTVFDPEIPVDIYELGLIYEILVDAERQVLVKMTLTSPACPSAQQIPSEVRFKIKALPEVKDAWVEIVWEPPWSKERMSEAAKLTLGFF